MSIDTNPGVRPQDDLFRHVNGRWLATAEIAADRASAGAFVTLVDEAEAAIRDIVQGLSGSPDGTVAQLIEFLHGSFMDEEAVDAAGLAPLRTLFAEIDEISSVEDLLAYFGRSLRRGTGSPVDLSVDSDPDDPSAYVLFVSQDGLGLPDEEYYRLAEHAGLLAAYRDHVDQTLAMAQLTASGAGLVVELETLVAGCHWDKVRCRDMRAMHNPMTEAEWAADFDWTVLLRAAGVGAQDRLVVAQPSFFTGLAALLTPSRLEEWRQWCRWTLVSNLSPYLPAALVQARFDFYGTRMQGIPALKPRWKRGVGLVERFLGEAVGQLYVARHFPASAKARMDELVADLIAAYAASIESLDWMTDATREQALAKLAKFTPKIGYPDRWKDYSGLMLAPGDLVGNVLAATEFLVADEIGKLGGPIRTWEWLMTPQTVNAYYHPLRNEIVFPAAILQPPFFSPDATDAANYGAIGAIIGHEIGHGFDDQGSTFDGDGRLRDWWTPADREAFEARTASLVAQYSALAPAQLPDVFVNGALTLGENIGDLGGLGIAYKAWLLACDRGPTGGRSPGDAREFFCSWAHAWRTIRRDEALREQIATDPHSPEEFRCNQVVRNLDAFYEAFGVGSGDQLWLDPAERVTIW